MKASDIKSDTNGNKEQVSDRRAAYRRKTHMAMLKIAIIFGVPALIATVAGLQLDAHYGTGRKVVLTLLALAFVFSWLVIIRMYRKMLREVRELDASEGIKSK